MVKTVYKFRLNVVNNLGLTKNWTLKGMPKFVCYILLSWVDFPAATHRNRKRDAVLPYNLKAVITGHTVSNLVFQQLYLKYLETSSPPILHTKNQNAKRVEANYRKHVEVKLIGRVQQVETNQHNFHLSDIKDCSCWKSSAQGRPREAISKSCWCLWPDPFCLHPAAPTAGTTVPVTFWFQPNHVCSPLTQLLFLTYKSATRGFHLNHICMQMHFAQHPWPQYWL